MLDRRARRWAEHEIARRAEAYYPGATAAATIGSPRFLWPLIRHGRVSDLGIRVTDADVVTEGSLVRLSRLGLDLHEVTVSRRELVRRRVRLRDLGSGRIEVVIDGSSLARTLRLPLVFHDDEVEVRAGVGPLAVSARGSLSVADDVVRFRPGKVQGVPLLVSMDFEFRLPTSPLWPHATEVRAVEGGLLLACDLDSLPPGLAGPPG